MSHRSGAGPHTRALIMHAASDEDMQAADTRKLAVCMARFQQWCRGTNRRTVQPACQLGGLHDFLVRNRSTRATAPVSAVRRLRRWQSTNH